MEYDEIILRPYLAAVGRRWHWILIGAVLAASVAVAISMLQPKEYEATASVLVSIRETNLGIGEEGPLSSIETIDAEARRQGLVALAQSDAIEARLPQEFVATIAMPAYRPGLLLESNRIVAYSNGDLISFLVTGPTGEEAQQLANVWARTFNDYIQELYNDELMRTAIASEALVPLSPSGPNVIRNGLLGFALGALLGLGLAMLAAVVKLPRFGRVSTPQNISPSQSTSSR